jgi:glycosyltransferase involved in cell wall biosynthesis
MARHVTQGLPVVSVILPVYNAAAYLHRAIQSILDQSLTTFELLICDDGSTDASASIIDSFDDPRIRVHRSPTNRGLVYQLNFGLEAARGRYIARMDADDVAHRHRLRRQVAFMDDHPDVGASGTHVRAFTDTRRYSKSMVPTSHDALCTYLLFGNPITHPTLILRRQMLQDTGIRYTTGVDSCEDYYLYTDLHRRTRLANIPFVGLFYRLHATNMSKTHGEFQRTTARARIREYAADFYAGDTTAAQQTRLDEHMSMISKRLESKTDIVPFLEWAESLRATNASTGRFGPRDFTVGVAHFVYRKVTAQRQLTLGTLMYWIGRHSELFFALPLRYRLSLAARSLKQATR